jgi:hypothetical protein
MTAFPNFPRILKVGLVLVDPESARVLRIIALQYNPDSLTIVFSVLATGNDANACKGMRHS